MGTSGSKQPSQLETLPIWTDRDRTRTKRKAGYQISGILQARNELIERFGCKHVLVFKKEKSDLEGCSEASGHCHQGPTGQACG